MAFQPRLTRSGMQGSPYWHSTKNPYYPDLGLPNCTCYAYGRFWELTGTDYNMPNANASDWWYQSPSIIQRSQTPMSGAIIVWSGGRTGFGHLAVVEQITSNGDIVVSQSGYTRDPAVMESRYFWPDTCYKNNGYRSNWMNDYTGSQAYNFMGFLLPPKYADGESPIPIQTTDWYGWNTTLDDDWDYKIKSNARIVYNYFLSKGYRGEVACAFIANMQLESQVDPIKYEDGQPNPDLRGYGLLQWTPFKYLQDWLDENVALWRLNVNENGNGQLKFISYQIDNNEEWMNDSYVVQKFCPDYLKGRWKTYKEFVEDKTSSIEDLTLGWLLFVGRGADSAYTPEHIKLRQDNAIKWYDIFEKGITPTDPTGEAKKKTMPVWMMVRRWY